MPKRNDVTGQWRRKHNEKLNDLYFSPNTIRVIKENGMGGTRSTYGERRGAYRVLVGRPEVKRPIGRPRPVWADNCKMGLQEVGWGGMDWIDLAQGRDRWRLPVNVLIKPSASTKCGERLDHLRTC